MTANRLLTYSLTLLLALLLLQGCTADTLPGGTDTPPTSGGDEDGSGVYVSVVVNADGGTQTRATGSPKPGEEGDGWESGINDENRVYDLNVFFFQGETDTDGKRSGINSANAEQIGITSLYFSEADLQYYGSYSANHYDAIWSVTKEVTEDTGLLIGETYDVLVVANYGRDMSLVLGQNTLAELRDWKNNAIAEDGTDGHHFLMASSGPETSVITIEYTNSPNKPSVVSVDVERLAARIDVHINDNGEYTPQDYPKDKAKITGMTITNAYKQPSYLFKRTDDGTGSATVYLGDETTDGNGRANNYVTDPQTLSADKTGTDFDNHYPDKDWTGYGSWDMPDKDTDYTSTGNDGTVYYRLGYVQENVILAGDTDTEAKREQCCTGITFRIEYTNNTTFGEASPIRSTFYKTYWIRHADDDADGTGIMEYAIVRNNIYQINVKNISGREKELNITVTTKDWAKKEGSITWN